MKTGERIFDELNRRGIKSSVLSEKTGIPTSTISDWKKGVSVKDDMIIRVAKFLDVSADYLLGLPLRANYLTPDERHLIKLYRNTSDSAKLIVRFTLQTNQVEADYAIQEEKEDPSYSLLIPVLGRSAAGSPTEMIENIDFILVHDPNIHERDFAVIASGDSMIDEEIFDGDIVVIRRIIEIEHQGQIVLVAIGDSSTIKRFYITESGYMLRPANSLYNNQLYSRDDDVRIIGKVVKVIHKTHS